MSIKSLLLRPVLSLLLFTGSLSAVHAAELVVGDQSYGARTVMEAAGVLNDLPYTLEWKQFTAGSPVAEALNAGSLDVGLLGDAPVLFLGALGAPIKVILAFHGRTWRGWRSWWARIRRSNWWPTLKASGWQSGRVRGASN